MDKVILHADNITITNIGSSNADVSVVLGAVEDTLGGCPISLINATHSTISDRGIDSFRLAPSLSAYDLSSNYVFETTVGGGANATSTRNYYFDSLHTMIPSVQLKGTIISANVLTTPMYSPEGIIDGNVYQRRTANRFVTMNDNVFFGSPSIVASPENEAVRDVITEIIQLTVTVNVIQP